MSEDGRNVVLQRYESTFSAPEYATEIWFNENASLWRTGCALDVETTGRHTDRDKVIEIGIRVFRFHRETGEVLAWGEGYSALEDPGEPLLPEIVRITGITDDQVRGKAIDWDRVRDLLQASAIVLAHNAAFDRPFLDRYVSVSQSKIWGCSFRQVNWAEKGFPSQKLEVLAIYHGFFNVAHRALADADALLHLLHMPDPALGTPYLKELLENARRPMCVVWALQSPIETKGVLRDRGYRWNTQQRVWSKLVYLNESDAEVQWLTDAVYDGSFCGRVEPLALHDGFKR